MALVQARARASITHCQPNHNSLAMATACTARAQRTVFHATPAARAGDQHRRAGDQCRQEEYHADASHGPPQRATGQHSDEAQGGADDDHHTATVP